MTYSVGFEDICAIIIIIRFIVLEKRKESQDLVCLYGIAVCVYVCKIPAKILGSLLQFDFSFLGGGCISCI